MAEGNGERVDPKAWQAITLDDISRKLDKLGDMERHLLHMDGRIDALTSLTLEPTVETIVFPTPYQYTTVNAGENGVVFSLEIPDNYVGVITSVGNSWFVDTSLLWRIDRFTVEGKIEREMAPITDPVNVRKFAEHTIEWTAYNDSSDNHVFEVITNGYFIERDVWKKAKRE